jgi:TolB-like protein
VKRMTIFRACAVTATCLLAWGCVSNPNDSYFRETITKANVYVAPDDFAVNKVAILPFKAPTELIGTSVSDMFVTEMLRAGRYELVERSQMAKVLGEAELALAGLSASKAAEVGAMMGADGVVIGTVDEYGTVAYRGHPYPVVGVSARMIDCKSGKVVWSVDLAERADDKVTTLSQHGRAVVHEMTSALYREWRH